MASPQLENGYTRIADEILESLATVKMSGAEWQFIIALLRKTYGFNKKEDWITNSQICEMVCLPKERVSEAKKRLLERNIIIECGNKIAYQKDYEKWCELRKNVTGVTEKRNKLLRKNVNTKDNKEIIKNNSEANASADDMNWKKQSDEYEEGVIDLDGDGTIQGEEKKPTRKYPNAPAVRKVFQEVLEKNPANWRVNATQLKACENLYTERGIEKIRNALEFYQENKDKEYCPQITSPYDLDSKWTKLGEFKLKQT